MDKSNPAEGQQTIEESTFPAKTTDNNTDKSNRKSNNENSKFNDTLREKMHAETPEQTDNAKNKKEKYAKKQTLNVYNIPCPVYALCDKSGNKTGFAIQIQNPLEPVLLKDHSGNIVTVDSMESITGDVTVDALKAVTGDVTVDVLKSVTGDVTIDSVESVIDDLELQVVRLNPESDAVIGPLSDSPSADDSGVVPTNREIPVNDINPGGMNHSAPMVHETQQLPAETVSIARNETEQGESASPKTPFVDMNHSFNADNTEKSFNISKPSVFEQPEPPAGPPQNLPPGQAEKPQIPFQAEIGPAKIQAESSIHQASIHKLNVAMEQVNALKEEKAQNLPENNDYNKTNTERIPVEAADSTTISEKPSVSTDGAKVIGHQADGFRVGWQIQESVTRFYSPGTQQIIIRLNPPDLGRVTIRFIEQRDGITGMLQVDKPQTRQEIQQALPEIVQNLQHSNVQIKKIEVVLNNQQQYTAGEQSGSQNGHSGQQNAPSQSSYENVISPHEIPVLSNNIKNAVEAKPELTDKSINMLI